MSTPENTSKRKPPRKVTPAAIEKLFKLIAAGHTVASAARVLGYDQTTFTKRGGNSLQARDPKFAERLRDAVEINTQELEHELYQRARFGVEEPVIAQGRLVRNDDGTPMTVRKYTSTDAYFILKARRPEVYRDNHRIEHTGADGGPVEISLSFALSSELADSLRE